MDGSDLDLKELRRQEKQLRNSINGIAKFVAGFKRSSQENQIEIRLETLEDAMRKFYSVRRKIEMFVEEEDAKQDIKETADARIKRLEAAAAKREAQNAEIVEVVEEQYFETKSALIALRPKKVEQPTHSTAAQIVEAPVSRVKLPDIKLPSFSGKVKDWVTFRDTFRSLIHSNRQLPAVDKFTYLRASLSGDALQDISSVELSADNYEVAWKILEKKYENKKLIVKAHLDAMFAVEPMKRENPEALNHLIGEFDKNLQMLKKIGEETQHWSTILAHMVCARLDSSTLRLWESRHNSKEVPKYEPLIDFLRDHCLVLQTITPDRISSEREPRRPRFSMTHTSSQSSQQRQCLFCEESYHIPFKCSKMNSMTVPQRVEEVNRKRLCRNCLTGGHFADGCSKGFCTLCGRKHHTMLHFDNPSSSTRPMNSSVPQTPSRPPAADHQQPQHSQTRPQSQTQNTPTQPTTQTTNSYPVTQVTTQNTHHKPTPPTTDQRSTVTMKAVQLPTNNTPTLARQVLISTAIVRVEDQFGNALYARTLLDSCSEFCYITSTFAKKLKFRETPYLLKVQGIGDACATSTKFVEAYIRPRLASISSFVKHMRFHVLPKITRTLPIGPVKVNHWPLPSNIVLADPTFWKPGPIDMIIGAEYYLDLLAAGRKKLFEDSPTLQETVLGWVMSGKIPKCPISIHSDAACLLNPQLRDGVMRVGGRLSNAPVPKNQKHPFILDPHHPFAELVVRHYHQVQYHAGQQLLIASVRAKFWPINIHNLARKVIHECIACFRNKPKSVDQIMADLPSDRVSPAPPFSKVGVDYCGPFFISIPNRKSAPVKNAPPLKWHLGRVVKIFHGTDGNVRVVTVRTKDGCFDRGITKVCPLPIRDNTQEN